jgi:1-aminocyclopropane-1-carboxylate deaminase
MIRGEAVNGLSHTLQMAKDNGMKLTFVDRDSYQKMTSTATASLYSGTFAGHYIIPEGGAGPLGEKGCREILDLVEKPAYTHICCAIGTATMYLGLINSSLPQQQVIGIPVLKGMDNLQEQLAPRIHPAKWTMSKLFYNYHFGGYAKKNSQLFAFMNAFYDQSGIPTDFVYTGKLLYAVIDLVEKNYFPTGSRLLVVHSGGLQGNMSLPLQTLHF